MRAVIAIELTEALKNELQVHFTREMEAKLANPGFTGSELIKMVKEAKSG